MLKHLYILIISTFFFGLITGGLIFFMSNTGQEPSSPSVGNIGNPFSGSFVVIGRMYGACESQGGCVSYRIGSDGAYSVARFDATGASDTSEGDFSQTQYTELRRALGGVSLDAVVGSAAGTSCPTSRGGDAYRYEIDMDGVRYSVNSCVNDTDGFPLFTLLESYFETLPRE